MKQKYLLSLIIPVYNSKLYIVKCLKSIIFQFNYKIEIIIVDDASTDNSISLIKNFLKKINSFHKIKILNHKINKGPGPSRNTGLSYANGKYIAFIDSDDIALKGFGTHISSLIKKNKYDIIEFGFYRFSKTKKDKFRYFYSFEKSQLIKNIKFELFAKTTMYPSLRVYKKEIWKNIRFPNYYYEDYATIYKLFIKSKTAFFIKKPLLAYRYNPLSITSNITKKNYSDMFKAFNSIKIKNNDHSLKILKIRLARSLCYFKNLFLIKDIEYFKMIESINKYDLPKKYIFKLKFQDLFFYKFTNFYQLIDKIRFKFKKL